MRSIITLFISIASIINSLYSQCTPPGTDNCEDALALCSLDELNGYTCQNVDYSNPTACLPCNGQGGPHNSSWWAFVTEGGLVSITISITNCILNGNGLQFGLVSACDCSGQIACQPNCTGPGTFTIQGNLQPCKIYYLWVDGCSSDVCTFTLTTAGGSPPKLGNLSTIKRSVLDTICVGCCSDFWVEPQSGGCQPEYVWTLDGEEIAIGTSEKVNICFSKSGTFSVCVEAVIGNPSSGSICDSKMKCTTAIIKKVPNEKAAPLIICANNIPYKWHCQTVTSSGEYRCPFIKNNCCEFDSVIQITVLPKPKIGEKYFIGCSPEKYIDVNSKDTFSTCQNGTLINLTKSTKLYQCDSLYRLYAAFINLNASWNWNWKCKNDTIIYTSGFDAYIDNCGLNATIKKSIIWFEKSDTNTILSTNDSIAIKKQGIYCFKYSIKTTVGPETRECSWKYCENFDESKILTVNFNLIGSQVVIQNEVKTYLAKYYDKSLQLKYIWKIKGGTILTPNAQDSSEIRVLWDKLDTTNYVCVSIMTECTTSPEQCINITKQTNTAIADLNNLSPINILPNPNDGNFIISWDKNLTVNKLSIINTEGKEIYASKISKNQTDIHIKDLKLKPGIYYARINSKNKIYTKAFVVQ